MEKESFVSKLRFLIGKFKNPVFTDRLNSLTPSGTFDFEKLIQSLSSYLSNADVVIDSSEDELVSEIEHHLNNLYKLANEGLNDDKKEDFIDSTIFLMDNTPESKNTQSVEILSPMLSISRDEFSERYDKLVDMLLDHKGENSNLVLETEIEKTPFKLFRRGGSIGIKSGKEATVMSVTKDTLINTLYHNMPQKYPSYEKVILNRLVDNSIFDFIAGQAEDQSNNDLLAVLNEKVKRQDGELTKLQETITQYEMLVEEVREAKNSIEATREDVAYEEAYKFWQDKSNTHKTLFKNYAIASACITILLLLFLYFFLQSHFDGIDLSYAKDLNQSISGKLNIGFWEKFAVNKIWVYTFIIVAMSMGIWLARITVKLTLSNYHIFVDANERVVMIKTYIALIKQGAGLDNNDRTTIFNALFRSTAFGAINDEPNIMLLEALVKSKT